VICSRVVLAVLLALTTGFLVDQIVIVCTSGTSHQFGWMNVALTAALVVGGALALAAHWGRCREKRALLLYSAIGAASVLGMAAGDLARGNPPWVLIFLAPGAVVPVDALEPSELRHYATLFLAGAVAVLCLVTAIV